MSSTILSKLGFFLHDYCLYLLLELAELAAPSPNKLITDTMCTSVSSASAITHSLLTLIQNLPPSAILSACTASVSCVSMTSRLLLSILRHSLNCPILSRTSASSFSLGLRLAAL